MRATALILAGLVAASLAACSSPTTNSACAAAPAGSASDSVKVTGDFGTEPTVEFTAPLAPKKTERTVTIPGKDAKQYAGANDEVKLDFALYDGTTGKRLTATPYTKGKEVDLPVNEKILHVGFTKTLACATAGSRIVGVIPAADGFGDAGSTDLGIAAGDSVVFVIDVVKVTTGVATGKDQPAVEGMPTVKVAKDGVPTVTIPDGEPPADLKIAVLKKGDGKVVADGDTVTVQYMGLIWNTGKVFDQSWDQKGAVSFATTGVVAGFGQAMVGQAVGSQVLVSIPPALGYGAAGNPGAGIGGTDTIVFVIDILDTAPTK